MSRDLFDLWPILSSFEALLDVGSENDVVRSNLMPVEFISNDIEIPGAEDAFDHRKVPAFNQTSSHRDR